MVKMRALKNLRYGPPHARVDYKPGDMFESKTDEHAQILAASKQAEVVEDKPKAQTYATRQMEAEPIILNKTTGKPVPAMTMTELRSLAKERGVTVPAGMKKANLVRKLSK